MSTEKKASVKKAPAEKTASAKKSASAQKSPVKRAAPKDATTMLKADHRLVSGLFDEFEKTKSDTRKTSLVAKICKELTVHAQLEEEIFYPAVKAALNDKELVPQATVEHASIKDLIAAVEGKAPFGEMYDAKSGSWVSLSNTTSKRKRRKCFPRHARPS